jgi:energy-coupling factor transporter ATP-binding protein EcfA2
MTKRLSRPDCVRKLSKSWESIYTQDPYLKAVSIFKSSPLRGIEKSKLTLEFPVSAICGANGSGKTTFLSLSVLGFHAVEPPLVPLRNIEYFDFNYFFRSSANDNHGQGIQVGWDYTDSTNDWIEKGQQRWLRYIKNNGVPRRPLRGTEFIGISRITPAFEKKNYHSYFSSKDSFDEHDHGQELRSHLSRIMSKPYSSISELTHANSTGTHTVQSYNKTHTSFNAGAGEECLSHIVGTLLKCPEGSIVAIEEIEIGLHPSTLPILVDVILEISLRRKLQVIITSHSSEFLRAFPKEGLILADRSGGNVEFFNQPNVEYAIRRIGGAHQSAASIICEDKVAEKIISNALPAKLRAICPIIGFGGKDQLIDKAEVIRKFAPNTKIIIVWDGAVPDSNITEAGKKGFVGCRLPGKLEPEEYLITKLTTSEGKSFLKEQYGLTKGEVHSTIESLQSISDIHDLPFVLAECLGMPSNEEILTDAVANFAVKTFNQEFENIVATVKRAAGLHD